MGNTIKDIFGSEILLSVIIIGYALFALFQNGKSYLAHKKGLKEYRNSHSECVWVDCSKVVTYFYILVALIFIGVSVALFFIAHDNMFSASTVFVTILLVAMILDAKTKRCVAITKGVGFYFEDKVYQFKAIRSMEPVKKLFMAFVMIKTTKGKSYLVTKKMGKILNEYYELSKKAKN